MTDNEIMARALVLREDLGDLTVNLSTAHRNSLEYLYNHANCVEWTLTCVDADGNMLNCPSFDSEED